MERGSLKSRARFADNDGGTASRSQTSTLLVLYRCLIAKEG